MMEREFGSCAQRSLIDLALLRLVPVFALTAQSTAYVTLYTAHTHQFRLSAAGIDVKLEGSIKGAWGSSIPQ